MSFEGYSPAALDFLWGIRFNNERGWFLAHKEDYQSHVLAPTRALGEQVYDAMHEKYPHEPFLLKMSRIYRDARRLFGRGPYKDHLWFYLKSDEILLEGPMFWFEIGAADFSYGMGFYSATPAQMAAFRRKVDANPARFERLAKAVMKEKDFRITGEEYARPKGRRSDVIDRWYNRKRLGIEVSWDYGGDVLSERLPEILVDCYEKLMPMFDFFMEVYREEPGSSR